MALQRLGRDAEFGLGDRVAKMAQTRIFSEYFYPFITTVIYIRLPIRRIAPPGILGKNRAFNSSV